MARLIATSGPTRGKEYQLKGASSLGRQDNCTVVVPDRRASRMHARIDTVGGKFVIQDLESRNGTYVNGQTTARRELQDGDEISICDIRFVFREDKPKPPSGRLPAAAQAADLAEMRRSMVTFTREDASSQANLNAVFDAENLVAGPASTAIDAAEAARRAKTSLKTIWAVANALVSVHDMQEVLEEVMKQLFKIFPQADRGFVMLKEVGTDELKAKVISSRNQKPGEAVQIKISSTVVNEVTTKRVAVLSSDAASDERFSDRLSIVNLEIRSMMAAPLIVQGEILGLIHLDTTSRSQRFTEQDLELLTAIAPQVAIAIKNSELTKEVEREAEKRAGLQRYLSPDLVDMYMKGELDVAVGGRSCRGTAFFSDLIGFSTFSEKMSPNKVLERLNRYFHVMEEIIFRNGGTIDKFGGDAIMALWGVVVERESAVLEAVTAALEMQNALFMFNYALGGELLASPMRMGIGLNTGELVAGNIGSEQKIEFTVIGDAVNLAQRLESKAGRQQVFVSEATFRDVMRSVAAVQLPEVGVKGRQGKVRVFSIRAVQPVQGGEGVVACLPVQVCLGPEEAYDSLVMWAKTQSKWLLLEVCTPKVPKEGSFVDLKFHVQEKPTLPAVKARVVAAKAGDGPGSIMVAVESPPKPLVQIVTPGNALPADITAEQVVRE